MKKILIILLITTITSCSKYYNQPIEHYTLKGSTNIWIFSETSFGLNLHRPNKTPYWYKCEKITINSNDGYLFFDNIEFRYLLNKDTLRLYENYSDVYPDTLKYTLIYDRNQQNFNGIFQKL